MREEALQLNEMWRTGRRVREEEGEREREREREISDVPRNAHIVVFLFATCRGIILRRFQYFHRFPVNAMIPHPFSRVNSLPFPSNSLPYAPIIGRRGLYYLQLPNSIVLSNRILSEIMLKY